MLQIPVRFVGRNGVLLVIIVTAVAVFAASWLVTRATAPRIRKAYLASGRVDRPGGRKRQQDAVPYGGGFAVLLGFAVPVIAGIAAAWAAFAGSPELLETHAAGIRSKALLAGAILLGASLMLLMGRADDRKPMRVGIRFFIQLLAAALVVGAGLRVTLFVPSAAMQGWLTLLWLVFVVNAHNFIDNMDGLLPGCALASTLAMAVVAGLGGQLFVCAFALALAGALAGMLPSNLPPARLYLGDEGSMFIGFMLACLATLLTYTRGGGGDLRPFLSPFCLLIVPVADAATVIFRRTLSGRLPWQAGRDHLSHRLVASGFSREKSVRILWATSCVGGLAAILLQSRSATALICAALFAVVSAVLLAGGRRS